MPPGKALFSSLATFVLVAVHQIAPVAPSAVRFA